MECAAPLHPAFNPYLTFAHAADGRPRGESRRAIYGSCQSRWRKPLPPVRPRRAQAASAIEQLPRDARRGDRAEPARRNLAACARLDHNVQKKNLSVKNKTKNRSDQSLIGGLIPHTRVFAVGSFIASLSRFSSAAEQEGGARPLREVAFLELAGRRSGLESVLALEEEGNHQREGKMAVVMVHGTRVGEPFPSAGRGQMHRGLPWCRPLSPWVHCFAVGRPVAVPVPRLIGPPQSSPHCPGRLSGRPCLPSVGWSGQQGGAVSSGCS